MIIEEARKFAAKKLAPFVEDLDEKQEANIAAIRELGELGYMGLTVPEQYGGTNMGGVALAAAELELSKVDPGTAVSLAVQNTLVNYPILTFGNDAQKDQFLPKLATGEWLGCFGLTEANAGSDPAGMKTTAKRDGDFYILNGSKIFITNGGIANVAIVFAVTSLEKGVKGISAFIVKSDMPGFLVGKHENKMGIRTSNTTELIFTDCRVPAENLLGEVDKGFEIALATLDVGRIGIAAQAIGIAEGAFDAAVKYAKERKQFGAPLSALPTIQFCLAEMATDIEVAKSMLFRTAWLKDSGAKRFSKEAAMIKLFAEKCLIAFVTRRCKFTADTVI